MLISSDKKSYLKKLCEINNTNKPYIQTGIVGLCLSLLMLWTPITWGGGYLFLVVLSIMLTFVLNYKLGDYTCLDFGKYVILLIFLSVATTPLHIIPMIKDYKTAEKYELDVPLDIETKLYYNDNNRLFVLFLGTEKQPLVLTTGGGETYHRLKADLLDNKISIKRKKIKLWYDDTHYDGYYLDTNKFN